MRISKKFLLVAMVPLFVLSGCGDNPISSGTSSEIPSVVSSETSSAQSSSVAPTVSVTDLTVDITTADLYVGDTKQINATVAPTDATEKGVSYSTTDALVATANASGVITAVGAGTCTITVSTKGTKADGNKITKQIAVTVRTKGITDLTVDFSKVTLKEGDTKQITATVLPANAEEKGVDYLSDNAAVASVSDTGLITAVGEGTCTITVTSKATNASDQKISKTIEVTVEKINVTHKVVFRNYDDSIIQAIDTIEAGSIPAFTEDVPQKPTDDNYIYIFRGFDKEFVAYVESDEEVTYKAVYQKVTNQAEKATLVLENEKPTLVLKGEAIGDTAESVAGKCGFQFMRRGGDWGTVNSRGLSPVFNEDGTWTMKTTIPDKLAINGTDDWVGRYFWNNDASDAKATDLKVYHLGDSSYRHDAEGNVLENGNGATEEEKIAYESAIKGPTWIGLGLTYVEDTVITDTMGYHLFSNADNWDCVAINTVDPKNLIATSANLVNIGGVVNYEIKGTAVNTIYKAGTYNTGKWDFQHNDNIDGKGWDTPDSGTNASVVVHEDLSWVCDIPVSDKNSLKDGVTSEYKSVFTIHFGSPSAESAVNLNTVIDASYVSITLDGYVYELLLSDASFNIPALVITAVPTADPNSSSAS